MCVSCPSSCALCRSSSSNNVGARNCCSSLLVHFSCHRCLPARPQQAMHSNALLSNMLCCSACVIETIAWWPRVPCRNQSRRGLAHITAECADGRNGAHAIHPCADPTCHDEGMFNPRGQSHGPCLPTCLEGNATSMAHKRFLVARQCCLHQT
jgi:hypothetical protein